MAWSDLPADLLRCISSHLPAVDFLRLSTVCSSWNSALASNYAFLHINHPPSPWLLLPSDAGEASDTLTFRDLTIEEEEEEGGCIRRFSSLGSHIFGRRSIGSKDGWLVTLDKTDLQPRLFNPLTKVEIYLPSLFTVLDIENQGSLIYSFFSADEEGFRDMYFRKIVLSSKDPPGTAVVIYGNITKALALARSGDQTWVLGPKLPPHPIVQMNDFEDVYYHEEERRFYAITNCSAVMAFDLNGQNVELICPTILDPRPYVANSDCRYYIAFLSKTLLKIERVIDFIEKETNDERTTAKTTGIYVFKFVPAIGASSSSSSSQWISVKDLGDYSLFVGCNQTFSLHHTMAPEIRPNCIYFSDHLDEMSPEDADCDAGLFDLHNDCFQYFLDSSSQPNWPPSIWFTPSLY